MSSSQQLNVPYRRKEEVQDKEEEEEEDEVDDDGEEEEIKSEQGIGSEYLVDPLVVRSMSPQPQTEEPFVWVPFRERVGSVTTPRPPSQYEIQVREPVSASSSPYTQQQQQSQSQSQQSQLQSQNSLKGKQLQSSSSSGRSNDSYVAMQSHRSYQQHQQQPQQYNNNNNNYNEDDNDNDNDNDNNYYNDHTNLPNSSIPPILENDVNNSTSATLPTIDRMPPSYVTVKKTRRDGINIHAGWNINPLHIEWQDINQIDATQLNIYQEELYSRLLSRFHGLANIGIRREEIANVFKENKRVVTDNLIRRLTQRPTQQQIENRGIVPRGYFDQGHENAFRRHHRKISSTMNNMDAMLRMRPKPEEIVKKGVVELDDLLRVYDVKDDSDDDVIENNINSNNRNNHKSQGNTQRENSLNAFRRDSPWDISLIKSLLFATIHEALQKSCAQMDNAEKEIAEVMQEIADNIKSLRDVLDNFDELNLSEQDEFRMRDKFDDLRTKLLTIAGRQQDLKKKAQILRGVHDDLIRLQNEHNHNLGKLQRAEETILERLQRTKAAKDRAERIKYAEHSHRHWAITKLDYTLSVAETHSEFLQKKIKGTNNENEKQVKQELEQNMNFSNDLRTFLKELNILTEKQQSLVGEYQNSIENMDSDLVRIRYEMTKVRQNTFAKIYELHKHVEIADTLDLGQRRISVANATDIEQERRHHATKIMRQLSTLQSQLKEVDIDTYTGRLDEIVDLQMIMSDHKQKAFFSVFVQSFCQTLIDVDLLYRQTNSISPVDPNVTVTMANFYGIGNVLNTIDSEISRTLDLKIKKTMRFIKTLQNAILCEQNNFMLNQWGQKRKKKRPQHMGGEEEEEQKMNMEPNELRLNVQVKIEYLALVGLCVGRKLNYNEHMQDEIDQTETTQVTRLAEMRCRDIFTAIVNDVPIFETAPQSVFEASKAILSSVWRIQIIEEEL